MKNDIFNLKGKVAVITGGYRGIGKSVAMSLADAGADIIVSGSAFFNGSLNWNF